VHFGFKGKTRAYTDLHEEQERVVTFSRPNPTPPKQYSGGKWAWEKDDVVISLCLPEELQSRAEEIFKGDMQEYMNKHGPKITGRTFW
jgi:hypothetical protein